MKLIILITIFTFSIPAFSRQYIQCGDTNSYDGTVINLDGENSTLYMTNGVHLPDADRISRLKSLIFHSQNDHFVNYTTAEGKILDTVSIPAHIIGEYSNSFAVTMSHLNTENGYASERVMYCFSAIY